MKLPAGAFFLNQNALADFGVHKRYKKYIRNIRYLLYLFWVLLYTVLEIQVKSSEKDNKKPYKIVFKWNKKARKNYIFIFYVEKENAFWIIPSEYLAGKDGKEIYGPNKNGYCSIDFAVSSHREWYKEFRNEWGILKNYS